MPDIIIQMERKPPVLRRSPEKRIFLILRPERSRPVFVVYGGKKYYFSPKTGAQVLGWAGINGQIYYFGQKGYALKGIYKIGSYRYSFNGLGELQKNTLVRGKYYADQRGRLARGWVTIGDNKYYFSYMNYAAVTGWRRIGGKVYYFNADGTLKKLSGVVKNSGNRYYYDPTTGEMTTGWVHSGVNDYYFSPKTGRALTGWQTINGKEYFSTATDSWPRTVWWATPIM